MKTTILILFVFLNTINLMGKFTLDSTINVYKKNSNPLIMEKELENELPLKKEIVIRILLGQYNSTTDFKKGFQYYESVTPLIKKMITIDSVFGLECKIEATLIHSFLFMSEGRIDEAIEESYKSLRLAERLNYKLKIAHSYLSLAMIEESKSNFKSSLDFYKKGLNQFDENDNHPRKYNLYNNIGYMYIRLENADSAYKYISLAYNYFSEINIPNAIAYTTYNFANIHLLRKHIDSSLVKYLEAKKMATVLNDIRLQTYVFNSLGEVYRKLNKLDSSVYYYNKCVELSKGNSQLDFARDALLGLHFTYIKKNKFENALSSYKDYIIFKDSVNSKEALKNAGRIEAKYEYEKKSAVKDLEYKVEIEKQNKTRNIALGTGAMLLLIVGGLYNRNKNIKKSRKIIELERDRSENLLLNILPAEIANELKEKGSSEARDFELVTILFTDFKEFTQTAENLTAKELVEEINVCFKAFDSICEKYHIEKIKTIGDSYMAAGGLPLQTPDSVKNAVLAAIEMNQFILERKIQRLSVDSIPFEMRLGLHSGPVVAGIVGIKKFQYDIWGDTVNTASRMESTGEIGKVNISQSTYLQIKDDPIFEFEYRGEIEAKGKGVLEMYFVNLK